MATLAPEPEPEPGVSAGGLRPLDRVNIEALLAAATKEAEETAEPDVDDGWSKASEARTVDLGDLPEPDALSAYAFVGDLEERIFGHRSPTGEPPVADRHDAAGLTDPADLAEPAAHDGRHEVADDAGGDVRAPAVESGGDEDDAPAAVASGGDGDNPALAAEAGGPDPAALVADAGSIAPIDAARDGVGGSPGSTTDSEDLLSQPSPPRLMSRPPHLAVPLTSEEIDALIGTAPARPTPSAWVRPDPFAAHQTKATPLPATAAQATAAQATAAQAIAAASAPAPVDPGAPTGSAVLPAPFGVPGYPLETPPAVAPADGRSGDDQVAPTPPTPSIDAAALLGALSGIPDAIAGGEEVGVDDELSEAEEVLPLPAVVAWKPEDDDVLPARSGRRRRLSFRVR